MVIDDFNVLRSLQAPNKTQPPLVVDPDAVLPFTAPSQRLKAIARNTSQIVETRCRLKPRQPGPGLRFNRPELSGGNPTCQALGLGASEGLDHFVQDTTLRGLRQDMDAPRAKDSNFDIERVENGTNIFRVKVGNVNAPVYQARLEQSGIVANVPVGDRLVLQVNETWNRVPAEEIAARFKRAMG